MALHKGNGTELYSIALQVVVLCCGIYYSSGTLCKDPENVKEIKEDLKMKLQQVFIEEMSLYNSPDFLRKANETLWKTNYELNSSISTGRTIRHQRINGHSNCLKTRRMLGTTVCPSYTILEYDSDREPATMVKVRCTCRNCYDSQATPKCDRKCWTENKCKEVNSYVPVIRRHCVGGIYNYTIYIEPVPVGCTCKQRRVIDAQ